MFEDGAAHAQSDPADDRAHTGYEKATHMLLNMKRNLRHAVPR